MAIGQKLWFFPGFKEKLDKLKWFDWELGLVWNHHSQVDWRLVDMASKLPNHIIRMQKLKLAALLAK